MVTEMNLAKEVCSLIEDYCKEGKYKRVPVGKEKSYKVLAKEACIPVTTIQNWLNVGVEPSLLKTQAVLGAMGYELVIRRIENGQP